MLFTVICDTMKQKSERELILWLKLVCATLRHGGKTAKIYDMPCLSAKIRIKLICNLYFIT